MKDPLKLQKLVFCRCVFYIFLYLFGISLFAQKNPSIESFSPEGEVKDIKQIVIQFSDSMIPMGSPKVSSEIFQINCPSEGKSRWLDDKTYIYQFFKPLESGIKCEFILKEGIKTLLGKEIIGKKNFSFNTGGPYILQSEPSDGTFIESGQYFYIQTSAEIDKKSLLENLYFSIDGKREKIEPKFITEEEEDSIYKILFRNKKNKNSYIIAPKLNFPEGKKVLLVFSKGILSKSGVPSTTDQILNFETREAFSLSFYCNKENAKAACSPFSDFYLNFNSYVSVKQLRQITLRNSNKTFFPNIPDDTLDERMLSSVAIKGPFLESSTFSLEIPADLKDDSGRSLKNQKKFPQKISFAKYPPIAKFPAKFGILELESSTSLPVSIRNLEPRLRARSLTLSKNPAAAIGIPGKRMKLSADQVLQYLTKIQYHDREKSIFENSKLTYPFEVPQPLGSDVFQMVGIPIQDPGFHIVEIESVNLGQSLLENKNSMFVPTTVLVTGMAVHLKLGRENSLVWVTQLKTAKPVGNASISVRDCKNKVVASGTTDSSGLITFALPDPPKCYYSPYQYGYLVIAEKENDLSFVHSSWNDGIENWRYNLPGSYNSSGKPIVLHTILDRSLFRAGEEVHMKHVLRKQDMKGFSLASSENLPSQLIIIHGGTNQKYNIPLKWNHGSAESLWKIPKEAKLGNYSIELRGTGVTESQVFYTSNFRVEEFRLPILRGTISPPKEIMIHQKKIPIDFFVEYLSGGGASFLDIQFKYFISDHVGFQPKGYEDYSYYSSELKEGNHHRNSYNYYLNEDDEIQEETEIQHNRITNISSKLNSKGFGRVEIENSKNKDNLFSYNIEMEYRDPNGEIQTISNKIPVYPSEYAVGLKQDSWIVPSDKINLQAVVLDTNKQPVANWKVKVEIFQRKIYSNRKRLVGGFYSYDEVEEIKKIGNFCEGKTDSLGLFNCVYTSSLKGDFILQASVEDKLGNKSFSKSEIFIPGSEDGYWSSYSNTDRIDLIPEKKFYEVGESARIQVKTPFKKSTALITIEREGILDKYIQEIEGLNPVIEVPIKSNYSPNIFVSVLILRGRIDSPKPTAVIDLGKPAHKLGITNLNIGWKNHTLNVIVTPEKEIYKVRDTAKVKIKLEAPKGMALEDPTEITLAAVDEALLELSPNPTWDLLGQMMATRNLEVETFTAQMQIIGRRHFGQKGVPQGGGGGGKEKTRELFNSLLLWKGTVKPDKNGEAVVNIPLNDSLTSFKIVGIAFSGSNLFGMGSTSIKTNQELMLLSGIPPLVREGDTFDLELTVKNNSSKENEILIEDVSSTPLKLTSQKIVIPPNSQEIVHWIVKVPESIGSLQYEFSAKSKTSSDRIKIVQKVVPVLPITVRQATLFQVDKEVTIPFLAPDQTSVKSGGVNVILNRSLVESTLSIKKYMESYPYSCLEQQASKAVALRDREMWNKLVEKIPSYMDENGFLKYFPSMNLGSTSLTSYILSLSMEAKWELPEPQKKRLETALNQFVTGMVIQNGVLETADLNIRKLQALEALSRISPKYAEASQTIRLNLNLLPTSSLIDYWYILERSNLSDKNEKIKNIEKIIRARLNYSGTQIKFSSEKSDSLYWLMVSTDLNSVRLMNLLLTYQKWKPEMGKLVNGVLQRQRKGIWDTTLANAFGILFLEKFSFEFEKESITGETKINYGNTHTFNWSQASGNHEKLVPWEKDIQDFSIAHTGKGKPWAKLESRGKVVPEKISNGYFIEKEILDENNNKVTKYKRGDILRIRLRVKSTTDMTWVVINDPIPAGASILSGGLRSPISATLSEKRSDLNSTFEERSFESYKLYYEYFPEGEYTLEYTIRLNQSGTFDTPQTRIEAMYSPDLYGEVPNDVVRVDK
jgi:alpha-2-macroglobulin